MGKHAASSSARTSKTLLSGGVVIGIGAAATLAAWSDATWASGVFNTDRSSERSGLFQLQSAPSPDAFEAQTGQPAQTEPMARMAALGNQEADSTTVSATVVLTPGRDTFLPMYLRTSEDSDSDALVSVSEANNGEGGSAPTPAAIWGDQTTPGLVTYGARIQQIEDSAPAPECSIDMFDANNATVERLFGTEPGTADQHDGLAPMSADAPPTQFTLAGQAENMYLVCFRFHLDSSVMTAAPEANGAPFQPSWTFTGEAIDQ